MIRKKDVIRMKIPFPDISSNLALKSDMYICRSSCGTKYEYVKCQTLKPFMLINSPIINYHDEEPDLSRNPFTKKTRIDCDKLFISSNVLYDDKLKTTARPDVSNEVFQSVEEKLMLNGYAKIQINEKEIKELNNLIK